MTPAAPASSGGFFSGLVSGGAQPDTEVSASTKTASLGNSIVSDEPLTGVRIQVASTRTEAEAKAVLDQLRKDHAALLSGGRRAIVKKASFGAMGTFYQVHVGPFDDFSEGRKGCARLVEAGFDCITRVR